MALKWVEAGNAEENGDGGSDSDSGEILRTVEEAEELVARQVEVRHILLSPSKSISQQNVVSPVFVVSRVVFFFGSWRASAVVPFPRGRTRPTFSLWFPFHSNPTPPQEIIYLLIFPP